jgi:hypothetical protein
MLTLPRNRHRSAPAAAYGHVGVRSVRLDHERSTRPRVRQLRRVWRRAPASRMTIERLTRKGALLVHQDRISPDGGIGEPTVVLVPYVGTIAITQGGLEPAVNVNIESVPELCRALRQLALSDEVKS